MPVIDLTDPCARAEYLRKAYYESIAGGGKKMIRYRGPNGEREVQYSSTNLAALQAELTKAEAECAAQNGGGLPTNRRFAIRAGAMRTGFEPK